MQADFMRMIAASDGQSSIFGPAKNMGAALSPEFLKTLSDCAGCPPVLLDATAVQTDSAPPCLLNHEDVTSDPGNLAEDLTGLRHRLWASILDSVLAGRVQGDPVAQDGPVLSWGMQTVALGVFETPPGGNNPFVPSPGSGAPAAAIFTKTLGAALQMESSPAKILDESILRTFGDVEPEPLTNTNGVVMAPAESLRDRSRAASGHDAIDLAPDKPSAESVTEEEVSNTAKGVTPGEDGSYPDFTDASLSGATPLLIPPAAGLLQTASGSQESIPFQESLAADLPASGGKSDTPTLFAIDAAGAPAANLQGTDQLSGGENGLSGGALESALSPESAVAALTAGFNFTIENGGVEYDLYPNVPVRNRLVANSPATTKDAPSPGNTLEGLVFVPAGSHDGTAEGRIRTESGTPHEASTGGLQPPNSNTQANGPVEEGNVVARSSPGVSAAQCPTTDLEIVGGDVGDETADWRSPRSVDPPSETDKPLFASGDQRAFVEILEKAGDAKASQELPSSVPTRLIKQLVDRATLSIKEGASEIRIALKPELLGHLQIEITTENHQVMVKVIAETHLAKSLLDQNLTQLKQSLQEQGLFMDKFDVLVAQNAGQFASGRQPAGSTPAQRTDRGSGDPETDADTRQEHDTPPRRRREDNARIDYFA